MILKNTLRIFLLLNLLLIFAACSKKEPEQKIDTPEQISEGDTIKIPEKSPLRDSILIGTVNTQSVERPIPVPGTVEADPARLTKATSPVTGQIQKLYKGLGDSVKIGDPLFVIDSADMAQAVSDADKAKLTLSLSKKELERQRELYNAEISAHKDLEQAENDSAQAESEMLRANTRLSQLGTKLDHGTGRQYVQRSPISGNVIMLSGAQGDFWNDDSTPIMTIADISKVWIAASVQEKDLSSIYVGQTAKITFNAYQGESFEGKVSYVAEVVDPDTRTIKVRIAIDNDKRLFRPGMFANIIFSGKARQLPVIPSNALIQSGFNTRVFVQVSPWVFKSKIIKTGAELDNQVEVLEGLKVGDKIIVKNGVLLND